MSSNLSDYIKVEVERAGAEVTGDQLAQLEAYFALLQRWGERIRLVGDTRSQPLIERNLPDALAWHRSWPDPVGVSQDAIDVGSGAGLPVIPFAILRPQFRFALVEPTQKRVAFLRTAVSDLGLNAEVHPCRLEQIHTDRDAKTPLKPADLASSRATWSPELWLQHAQDLIKPGGWIAVFLAQAAPPSAPAPIALRKRLDYQLATGSPRRLALYQHVG